MPFQLPALVEHISHLLVGHQSLIVCHVHLDGIAHHLVYRNQPECALPVTIVSLDQQQALSNLALKHFIYLLQERNRMILVHFAHRDFIAQLLEQLLLLIALQDIFALRARIYQPRVLWGHTEMQLTLKQAVIVHRVLVESIATGLEDQLQLGIVMLAFIAKKLHMRHRLSMEVPVVCVLLVDIVQQVLPPQPLVLQEHLAT